MDCCTCVRMFSKKDPILFTVIGSNTSGIHFQNTITETEQLPDSVNNWQFVKENILDKEKVSGYGELRKIVL